MQTTLTFPTGQVGGDAALTFTEQMVQSLAGHRSGITRPDDVQVGETWLCTATTAWQLNLWTGTVDLLLLTADTFAGVIYFAGLGAAALLGVDTDGTLAANSDNLLATQKAVKTFVADYVAANPPATATKISTPARVVSQALFGGA